MDKIERHIDGAEFVFYGPNMTLVNWMEKSKLAEKVFEKSGVQLKTMYRALSKNNAEDQLIAGKEIIRQLWHAYPELGPYPFLDTLSDFEFMGKFYPDYREHVNHQLRVFWLGLYLFDRCAPLRENVLAQIDMDETHGTEEFLKRWQACAVYHDIGYVFENKGAEEANGEAWQTVCRTLNDTLQAPLSHLPASAGKLNRETEWRVIQDRQIFRPQIKVPKEIEYDANLDLLDMLADFGKNAGLASETEEGKSPFRKYYDYALAHDLGNRPRFRDHGIASAMMMLKIWLDFKNYIFKLSEYTDDPLLTRVSKDVNTLHETLIPFENTIKEAAGAVALHNIAPFLWDQNDTLVHGLTLQNFEIRLLRDGLQDDQAPTPMAFLLGLADALQTWDRPRFRAMRKNDVPGLTDQDMHLCVNDNQIYLFFNRDDRFKSPENEPDSLYAKTIENIKGCLDNQAIENLMLCRKCETENGGPHGGEDNQLTAEDDDKTPGSKIEKKEDILITLSRDLDISCLIAHYQNGGTPISDTLLAGLPEDKIPSDLHGMDYVKIAIKALKASGGLPALFILVGIQESDGDLRPQIKTIVAEVSEPARLFPYTWSQIKPDDRKKIDALWADFKGEDSMQQNDQQEMTFDQVVNTGLFEQLIICFPEKIDADILLTSINYPQACKPSFTSPKDFWYEVCQEISRGQGVTYKELFKAAASRYPANKLLADFRSL